MTQKLAIRNFNTILYCKKWRQTVAFYKDELKLPISFETEWFVEFKVNDRACLSVADESKATINSNKGAGITLSFQTDDIHKARELLHNKGLAPGSIKEHAWGAQVFYLFDPEGHRIEIWSLM